MVANHPSGFFDLAAAPRQPLDAMPTSPRKTRVRGFRRHASGQTSSRRRCRSINTPGSRGCGYKTVSGRHEFINRDHIGEWGGINLYAYVGKNPVNRVDPLGLQMTEVIAEQTEEAWPVIVQDANAIATEIEAGGNAVVSDVEAGGDAIAADASSLMQKIQDLGKTGERAACIKKNTTRIPSLNGTANYRIPDVLNPVQNLIGEVKNVQYLSMTPQLQDFLSYAQQNGYNFQLTVDANTYLSSSVVNAVSSGAITLSRMPLR